MSRGLGDTQRRTLAVLNGHVPPSIRELAEWLGIPVRRCRKIVDSLAERGEVVVTDERPARVWLAWRREQHLDEEREERERAEYVAELIANFGNRQLHVRRTVRCRWCGSDVEF
jgi:predicted ArsR family transcriptional regulator